MRIGLWNVSFFKQKTAYDVRISDWSSDVCSSDLISETGLLTFLLNFWSRTAVLHHFRGHARHQTQIPSGPHRGCFRVELTWPREVVAGRPHQAGPHKKILLQQPCEATPPRSEEHTSELQSLMRNSYAVFCLKKKQ